MMMRFQGDINGLLRLNGSLEKTDTELDMAAVQSWLIYFFISHLPL
jgi:hypothetical protein